MLAASTHFYAAKNLLGCFKVESIIFQLNCMSSESEWAAQTKIACNRLLLIKHSDYYYWVTTCPSVCVCGGVVCDTYIITKLRYYWLIYKTYQSPTLVAMGTLRQWVGEVRQLVAMVTIFPGADVHAVPSAQLAQPWWLLFRFAVRVQYNAHPQGTYRHTYAEVNKTNSQLL